MPQHSYLLADALRRERQLAPPPHLHHLRALASEHSLRRRVARALVRLARAVEPGAAGGGAPSSIRLARA